MAVAPLSMWLKGIVVYLAALAVLGLVFFVPAGTLDYWQAWAYIAVVMVPATFVILYFMLTDPEFMIRRMKYRETEAAQKRVIGFSWIIFVIGFVLPGLDQRFGWSHVPAEIVVAADALVFLGYVFVFWVFRENRYAARIIQVEKGQTVISTGPYSMIRHPMYLGTLLLYLATPIALGSYWALPPFILMVPVMVLRILNEEQVLLQELPGYKEYCQKTRFRLVPLVW